MKNFFTSLFGALVALIIFFAGGALLLVVVIMAMAAAAGQEKAVVFEKGSYLVFNASVNLTDAPPPFDPAALGRMLGGNEEMQTLQLRQVTNALRAAAKDDRIAGVFLHGSVTPIGYGSGYAALREVREALETVKAAGKPVVAHLDYATTRDMYLMSVANDLVLDPYGAVFMPGLATEPMFLAGAFEKYGVGIQVTRVGKFKSAVEPYIRKDMSPENRQQIQKLLDDVWGTLLSEVAAARDVTPAQLQTLVDTEGVLRAEQAVASKLVNRSAYKDEIIAELKEKTGRAGSKETFKQVSMSDYAKIARLEPPAPAPEKSEKSLQRGKIAVVYAEGAIVEGEGQPGEVGGEKFARELRKLRQDDEIKAIVLRVNSPGGSVTASEHIQRELRLAKAVKPVVVSMGSYAASGGYWISAYGDRIFAEPSTLTGSIGVFGLMVDVQRLANDFGLTFDRVKTGRFADTMTVTRPKTPEELVVYQSVVDWIYDQFLTKVVEGRNLDRAKVEEIAQGRVWSGTEALSLGLVDEIGGLDAALRFAAEKANLGDNYRLQEFPRKMEFAEFLAEALSGGQKPASARAGVVSQLLNRVQEDVRVLDQFNDSRGVYARLPLELQLR